MYESQSEKITLILMIIMISINTAVLSKTRNVCLKSSVRLNLGRGS